MMRVLRWLDSWRFWDRIECRACGETHKVTRGGSRVGRTLGVRWRRP